MVVGLLDNESPDSNRLTLVTPKSENDVRLQATLGNQNPMGLPVGAGSRDSVNMDVFMYGSTPENLWSIDDSLASDDSVESADIFATARKNNFLVGSKVVDAIILGNL